MKKKLAVALITLAAVGALSTALTLAQAQTASTSNAPAAGAAAKAKQTKAVERHPAIRHAIVALEAAKSEMQSANHDFGGHRKQALADCDKAIQQLRLALQFDRN
jgi:hypothetical protein